MTSRVDRSSCCSGRRLLPAAAVRILIATAIAAGAGCRVDSTAVIVTVEALEGVGNPTDMLVSFAHHDDRHDKVLEARDGPVFAADSRRATFAIQADGRSGPAEIAITGRDAQGATMATGRATVIIVEAVHTPVTIHLHPSDFQVNSQVKGSQFFSTSSATGRQLASDDKGNFAVVWEDSCPGGQCQIFARMFDPLGNPRLKEDTGTKDDFVATDSGYNYDMPAIAMRGNGEFVIVWKRYTSDPADGSSILSRAFAGTGRPISSEQLLSAVENVSDPDIAALPASSGSAYVVVWQQMPAVDTHQVVGQRLDASGAPITAEPFLVASFASRKASVGLTCVQDLHCPTGEHCSKSSCQQIPVAPAVAAGPVESNGAFIVIWNQNGSLRGRTYIAEATPVGNAFDVAVTPSGRTLEADASAVPYGYAVIWTDVIDTGSDTDGACIRLRRFDVSGQPLEEDFTFNTTTAGRQRQPAIAMRAYDGNLLAVWTSEHDTAEDPLGGIRGRLLLSNGLPLGPDFQLNTTTAGAQLRPSVAPKGSQAGAGFVVVFEDDSGEEPDTDGSGIRGRFYYPGGYDARDRQIGALCERDSDCGSGLACASTQVGARCISTCEAPGAACPDGGRCMPAASGARHVCTYPTSP